MTVIYIAEPFNAAKAGKEALCAVADVDRFYTQNQETGVWTWKTLDASITVPSLPPDSKLKGIGVCTLKDDTYVITLDGIKYEFSQDGVPRSKVTHGLTIVLLELASTGTTTIAGAATRAGDEHIEVDSIRPIDEFAIRVLTALISNTSDNVLEVSKGLKAHYCQQAYEWAEQLYYISTAYLSTEQPEPDPIKVQIVEET